MSEPSSKPLELGDIIDGRYELRRMLGRGTEAVVYEAQHVLLRQRVALKIVAPNVDPLALETQSERLLREARVLARLRHPGIVSVLDAGMVNGRPYVALELLEGRTLEGLLAARGRLPAVDAVALGLGLCDALAVAHVAGVVHRDVKPSNVVVYRDGAGNERIKLLDFGTSKQPLADGEVKLTAVGAIVGTPAYMSPEQFAGGDVDARADVYALGAILFECLTGHVVYEGNYAEIVRALCAPDVPPPSLRELVPGVDPALAGIVQRAISKRSEERPADAAALGRELRAAIPAAVGRGTQLLEGPAQAQDVRKHPRAPYLTPLRVVTASGITVDGRSEDISEGGILMLAPTALTAGEKVTVRFALPIEGHIASCQATVRWAKAARPDKQWGAWAIGLELVDAPSDVSVSIGRYVSLMRDPRREDEDSVPAPAPTKPRLPTATLPAVPASMRKVIGPKP